MHQKIILLSIASVLLMGSMTSTLADKPEPSLLQRLGGTEKVHKVVDDFINQLLANPSFESELDLKTLADPFTRSTLQMIATTMISQALQEPNHFNALLQSPEKMQFRLTQNQWQELNEMLNHSLNQIPISDDVQNEIKERLEQSKGKLFFIVEK